MTPHQEDLTEGGGSMTRYVRSSPEGSVYHQESVEAVVKNPVDVLLAGEINEEEEEGSTFLSLDAGENSSEENGNCSKELEVVKNPVDVLLAGKISEEEEGTFVYNVVAGRITRYVQEGCLYPQESVKAVNLPPYATSGMISFKGEITEEEGTSGRLLPDYLPRGVDVTQLHPSMEIAGTQGVASLSAIVAVTRNNLVILGMESRVRSVGEVLIDTYVKYIPIEDTVYMGLTGSLEFMEWIRVALVDEVRAIEPWAPANIHIIADAVVLAFERLFWDLELEDDEQYGGLLAGVYNGEKGIFCIYRTGGHFAHHEFVSHAYLGHASPVMAQYILAHPFEDDDRMMCVLKVCDAIQTAKRVDDYCGGTIRILVFETGPQGDQMELFQYD